MIILKYYYKRFKNISIRGWLFIASALITFFVSGALTFKFYDKSYTRGYWHGWDDAVGVVKRDLTVPVADVGFRLISPTDPKKLKHLIRYQSADTTIYNEF